MGYTAFQGTRRLITGSGIEVALFLRDTSQGTFSVFDDATGRVVDLHPDGSLAIPPEPSEEQRGRGRPKLGVIPREVTLLPRHWDWLNLQPGGASVTLRRLVEEARKASGDSDRVRAAQEAAYRFMSAIAGNLPGFEEASRALFAYERRRFGELIAAWPADVRDYAIKLAYADQT